MNYGPLVFLAAFFALAASWFGFVLTPHMQVGHLQQTNSIPAGAPYPVGRPGLAKEGIEVYRANGCAYCHSQQVCQNGTVGDVLLTDVGTNAAAVIKALAVLKPELQQPQIQPFLGGLPKPVLEGVTRPIADNALKVLKAAGAKAELWIAPVGPDIARAWGKRRSVAEDFLYDYPVMPGEQRIGPDLAGVGMRLADANWHLQHLYAPRSVVKDSVMPPYRFLFETRKIERAPSTDALPLTGALAPPPGKEVVPKPEAKALVAYLLSLRTEIPLYDAPLTVPIAPPAETNAPAGGTATNAVPTNAPAK